MSGALSSSTARIVVWDTKIPTRKFWRSPVFYFQNCECFFNFGLLVSQYDPSTYYLCIGSKNEQKFFQSFNITSYIDNDNDLLSFQKREISGKHPLIGEYPVVYESKGIDLRSIGRMKIVMIIHGTIGSTLRLKSKNGNPFRDVSVGTNDESDVISPTSSSQSRLEILSNDFSKLLDEDLYHDVELQCGDHTFKAHKNVLSTRSKVFLSMLKSDMIEGQTAKVKVEDMQSNVCKELLHYMYSGKLQELTSENARALYEAGDRYNVTGLMEPCAEFLEKKLTPDNACEVLVLADAHSDESFKEKVIEYMLYRKIPLDVDLWKAFCRSQPLLASEVLNRYYWSQNEVN